MQSSASGTTGAAELAARSAAAREKLDQWVLVENLRRTAAAGAPEPGATLIDTFDGLEELDLVDFRRHPRTGRTA